MVNPSLMNLFERCFGESRIYDTAYVRPSMSEWHEELNRTCNLILQCPSCQSTFMNIDKEISCPFCHHVIGDQDVLVLRPRLVLIEKDELVGAASANGEYLLGCLLDLQNKYGDLMSNSRGKGLFCAFDLPSPEQRDKFITEMEELGVLILGCGHRSIRFRPHLNITKGDIDIGISMIGNALSQL